MPLALRIVFSCSRKGAKRFEVLKRKDKSVGNIHYVTLYASSCSSFLHVDQRNKEIGLRNSL